MKCPRCQADNREGRRFCTKCGTSLAPTCPSCGFANDPGDEFCGGCGASLTGPAAALPVQPATRPQTANAQSAGAERRQLTVMFCDLVDSTQLSSRLDPEVLREVVRAYQHLCGDEITRFAGHVAQYLGDGLLVYFGYPSAHEDGAQRAVRAALGIIAALETLNTRLHREKGIKLALRVGIHTGLVVVGEIGGAGRRETLALGETPNIAARLQAIAEPDTIAISAATYRLVQDVFVCLDLGDHAVKGVPVAVRAYLVQGENPAVRHRDTSASGGFTPLVGREQEVGLLLSRWEQVKDGLGQVVLLSGEPGIGKSRLVRTLKEHIAGEPHTRWECRCSAYHQDSALYPVVDLFERALQFGRDELPDQKLAKIDAALARYGLAQPEAVALWAALLSVPLRENHRPLNLTPQRQKQKTFEAILGLLHALATEQPLVFIIEDLHWGDPSTRELLDLILEQVPTTSILMLLTFRPEFRSPWGNRAHLTQLPLSRFTRRQTEVMVERVTGGKELPVELLQQVVAKTDGVPLFVEELTKMVLESGLVREQEDRYVLSAALPPLAIPSTLQDSLMARLDRLAMVKDVAQHGAALGRTFPYELLAAVASTDETTLQGALARLVGAELLYQRGVPPDATYIFKHALIQETAYQSMLMSRRRQLHQQIAQVLVERFAGTAETQPELVAHHYTEAGLMTQAIEYWRRAGERAIQRSANPEAIAHLTRGLGVLKTLPDSPARAERELLLQIAKGVALAVSKGWASREAEETHSRALELCQHVGETPQLFTALQGLGGVCCVRGEIRRALELMEQALSLAERIHDPTLLVQGHFLVADQLFWFPELASARIHLERALALYDPDRDRSRALLSLGWDPSIASLAFLSRVLWHLGYPDEAVKCSDRALSLGDEIAHPFSQSWALSWAAALHQLRHEVGRVQELAEADIRLATEQVIPFLGAHGMVLRGWALVEQGHGAEGIAQLRDGLAAYRATGAEIERSHWNGLLAEAYELLGQPEEGLRVLVEALAEIERNGVRYYEAELHRLRGELLLKQDAAAHQHDAEIAFHQAIDVASSQHAKSLELRAALSLSRLLQRRGKRGDARRVLADVHGWFTEGFDTADLKAAKELLDELSAA